MLLHQNAGLLAQKTRRGYYHPREACKFSSLIMQEPQVCSCLGFNTAHEDRVADMSQVKKVVFFVAAR